MEEQEKIYNPQKLYRTWKKIKNIGKVKIIKNRAVLKKN